MCELSIRRLCIIFYYAGSSKIVMRYFIKVIKAELCFSLLADLKQDYVCLLAIIAGITLVLKRNLLFFFIHSNPRHCLLFTPPYSGLERGFILKYCI